MKRWISAFALGVMLWGAAPANAQTGPDYDMKFDLTYTPLRVSTSDPKGVCHANMPAITFSGEGKIYRGIMFGGSYTKGGGNGMVLNGLNEDGYVDRMECRDTDFRDLKLYAKIPFNFEAFGQSSRVVGPEPKFSPFYGYVGYKNTSLTAKYPSTAPYIGKVNAESSSGVGIGLGCDVNWDPVGLYGQIVYYPAMFTKNVGVGVENGGTNDGTLRVWEWDLGVHSNFKDSPIQAKIGYHFEQHQASNVKLNYDGFQIGATAEF